MCKYKDTNLGIKKLDFNVKRGAIAAYLTDGREIIVPVSMFPDINHLSKKQREDYMIMDDQYSLPIREKISRICPAHVPQETPPQPQWSLHPLRFPRFAGDRNPREGVGGS